MVFVNCFKTHMELYPRIAAAFEEFKPVIKGWFEKDVHADELYKNAISNFMHGAFRCTEKPVILTSW